MNEIKVYPQEWEAHGVTKPVAQYHFHPSRQWRFDYAWPDIKLAIELEGIFYKKTVRFDASGKKSMTVSRHQTGSGYDEDTIKYNAAVEFGWSILRYTNKKIDWLQIERVFTALKMKCLLI